MLSFMEDNAKTRKLPETASVAHRLDGSRMTAPSAVRNADAIADVLLTHAPQTGRALEIASGTGQHVVHFARTLPGLIWQPSDIATERLASINAWVQDAELGNIKPACHLDAATPGWAERHGGQSLILVVNLTHLISTTELQNLIREMAKALTPGGSVIIYGPFLRDGRATSDGDARFHASLVAQDPRIGYKSDHEIKQWLQNAGLVVDHTIEMPANNLCLIANHPICTQPRGQSD